MLPQLAPELQGRAHVVLLRPGPLHAGTAYCLAPAGVEGYQPDASGQDLEVLHATDMPQLRMCNGCYSARAA